jgi:hypothetical protein
MPSPDPVPTKEGLLFSIDRLELKSKDSTDKLKQLYEKQGLRLR